MGGSLRNCATALAACAVMVGSTANAAPRTVDPLVALSVFGTSESRAAVCAAGAQAAAAAGAAAAQAGKTGCVLPVMDAVPPPPTAQAAPPPAALAPVVAESSVGALPLMLGLVAIAAFASVVILHNDKDGEINLPISP